MDLDKRAIVSALRAQLQAEIDEAYRLARDAAEAATHEENKPENDKDMRSTEASYLARGQAARVAELEAASARLAGLELKRFGKGAAIEASAVVTLSQKKQRSICIIVPAAGGRRVKLGDVEVQAITPTSPLGEALVGLSAGDEAEVGTPQGPKTYEILDVR